MRFRAMNRDAFGQVAILVVIFTIALVSVASASFEEEELTQFCPSGSQGGKCQAPMGIAASPATGDLYVNDLGSGRRSRVQQFSAWGEFLRTWGWDVVASGPNDDTSPPEDEFEVCVPAEGDECKNGRAGDAPGQHGGAGQLLGATGVTLDSAGNVYVVDHYNRRVQKFGPEGQFLLMFGGDVNKTKVEEVAPAAERNLCPVDPGDVCQEGVTGGGQGEFGLWGLGSIIAASPDGQTIYVGDVDRIQEFDTEGHYIGETALPETGTVGALAADPNTGDLYFSYVVEIVTNHATQPNVHRLDPDTGSEVDTLDVPIPSALAVDAAGNVYAVERANNQTSSPPHYKNEVLVFDPSGNLVESFAKERFEASFGLATSSACGIDGADVFLSNSVEGKGFVRIYGPSPDGAICPPPEVPPEVKGAHAVSVGTNGATVKAMINPHFWPDTNFYVEYGTGECSEGGCDKAALFPGTPLGVGTKNAFFLTKGIFLGAVEELVPDTTYHFRFIAQSSGGGPVFSEERAFHTFPLPSKAKGECPNQAFRTGASAALPNCRAYEMVSPVDKNNGDIARLGEVVDQSTRGGDALTFGALSAAFADPLSGAPVHQYLTERDPTIGWTARSIAAPRNTHVLYFGEYIISRFKLFTEDLCSGWLLQDTDTPLVEGAPRGVGNLYRRHGLRAGCGGGGYELLSTEFPPEFDPIAEKDGSSYFPMIQGFSADGEISVFRADGALTDDACHTPKEGWGIYQLYLSEDGSPGTPPKLVSVLPGGEAACTHSSAGTYQAGGPFSFIHDSIYHAVSADAARVFWTATSNATPPIPPAITEGLETGQLYLRLNPAEPKSAFAHGSARGKGDLIGPASATGNTIPGVKAVSKLNTTSGSFAVGQFISGPGIPAETKITKVEPEKLTLDKAATANGSGVAFTGAASKVVSNVTTESGAFAVGQKVAGPGVAPGSTIAAVEGGTLTLSTEATATKVQVSFTATSACTEPAKACTLPVSEEAEGLSGTGSSRYLTAAVDGSVAIFQSGDDLYEFDVSKALEGNPGTTLIAGEADGIVGSSADASRIYLVSGEDLDEGATAGQHNLYLYERGAGLSFIGGLGGLDVSNEAQATQPPSPIATIPTLRSSRVSPDGLRMAFTSSNQALAESAAGYDNRDVSSDKPASEVYLYDATANGGAGELLCVSCNPSGARPSTRQVWTGNNGTLTLPAAAQIPGWMNALHPSRALTDDGRRLLFESFEALVPRDTNGRADVYEWERVEGSTEEAKKECLGEIGGELLVNQATGCLSLISSGQDPADVEFVDASADGRDIFFLTSESLLPYDPGFRDIYDAREKGGFPLPPPPEPPCEGDACQAPPPPPNDPTPGSATFKGSGNLPAPKPCAKGKRRVVRKGKARCVPKHAKKRKRNSSRRAVR